MKRIKVLKAYLIIWLFIDYVVWANIDLLSVFFMATVVFSSAILGLLAVGSLYQTASGFGITMLGGTFGALAYKKTGYEFYLKGIDSLLPANIAHMLKTRKSQQKMLFTQEESRNIIEWLNSKFSKQKSYTNFFINTSMLIGLLGTFVGLVEAIDNMGQIILSLNGEIDVRQIMQDFSGPLSGMAIGFGASLFGVVCAVILGINGYVLFRSQDTLISGVEDWLKERIIDVAPETLGRASNAAGSELPEQRKSFIDIFLEQMTSFTHEISKLTKSNENFHAMSETLTSMKAVMDTHSMTFEKMAISQNEHALKFAQFMEYVHHTDAQKASKHEAEQRALSTQFETNNALLQQTSDTLLAVNNGVVNLNNAFEVQLNHSNAFLEEQKQMRQQHAQEHQYVLNAFNGVKESIEVGTQTTLQQLANHERTFDAMLNRFLEMSETLLRIFTQCETTTNTLLSMIASNTEHFHQSQRTNQQLSSQLDALKEQLSHEMQAITNATLQHHAQEQTRYEGMMHLFENVASTLHLSKEALDTLAMLQKTFAQESQNASAKLSDESHEIAQTLLVQQNVMQSLLSSHEHFYATYNHNETVSQQSLETIHSSMSLENETTRLLLQSSEALNQLHQKAQEQASEHFDSVNTNLIRIEEAHRDGLEQQKTFETVYLKTADEAQASIIAKLSSDIAQTNQQLASMNESLKTIEEMMVRIDKSNMLHGGGVASEIKGFFSSFFHKNSNEQKD